MGTLSNLPGMEVRTERVEQVRLIAEFYADLARYNAETDDILAEQEARYDKIEHYMNMAFVGIALSGLVLVFGFVLVMI